MSGSDRADGQTGGPRDVFSMPREYSFSCVSESNKEKRRDRDVFQRRLSSSISLDGGAAGGPPSKRRLGGELMSSGRSGGGLSSNGWHDEIISRSKSFTEPGTHGGNSSSRVAPRSPRVEFSSPDGSSPKEMDGYRFSSTKPSSPLFAQSRISPLAQATSHHSYSGKGILGREHSRYSEWDYSYKADMDYRDKIWGRTSELHRRTGSVYESSPTSTMHKDSEGRREHEGYGGSGDSPGSGGYHMRSYPEWRQSDRISTAGLPLRSHVSTNGYLKESGGRGQGFSDVLGSWHSPLSSPANYAADGGRDDGIQTSPRKRPRLGWGQGLAKYEQKITGIVEDTKGRGTSCSEEISTESPHQATGHEQTVSSTKSVSDKTTSGASNLCPEVDKDTPLLQMEQKPETPGKENVIDKSKQSGSMPASMTGRLENYQSLDVPLYSDSNEKVDSVLQVHPQFIVPGQYCNEDASGSFKANILQRLEKLELELELTEKELGKLDDQPEEHPLSENDSIIDLTRNSTVLEGQFAADTTEQKDVATEVLHASGVGEPEREAIDEPRETPFSGIQVTSLDETTDTPKGGSKLHVTMETQYPSFDSSYIDLVNKKDDDGLVKANNSQVISFKERSLSASSFSELDKMAEIAPSKEISSENPDANGQSELFIINKTTSEKHVNECWKDLFNENTEEAKKASKVLSSLIPDADFEAGCISVCKFKEIPVREENIEKDEKIEQQLQDMLLQKKMSYRFRELVLALKYRALRESWKREQVGLCQWTDRIEGLKKLDVERKNGTVIPTQRSSHRLRLSVSGTVKVDSVSDELHTMQKLLSEPFAVYHRPHLKMPSQILDERERNVQRFITNNFLIEDPVAFEQERKTINPWTPEEKKMFLEKFALYNKDFQKIASFIEHKTVADCIEFYYRNQKSEDFETVRHRLQLKNCRDYPRSSTYLVHSTPPSSRRREIAANCVDKLPTALGMASYKEDGSAVCSNSNKHVQNDHIDSVVANSFENPPGNSGSASWRNITMEQFNKVQVDQSSESPTSITEEYDSQWTDSERQLFVTALGLFGKDFRNISQHVATKSEGQCKVFFSKTRKRLGLDQVLQNYEKSLHKNSDQAEECTEDLNVGVCAEHEDHDHISTRVKDLTGEPVRNCLPSDSVAGLGMFSANSTEELLTTDCISTGNGEEVCNKEDEISRASDPDLGDSLPENNEKAACSNTKERTEIKQEMAVSKDVEEQTETKQEKAQRNDIEDQTQGTELNVTALSTETWIEPKEEKYDFSGILMNPVSEPQTQDEYANHDTTQQEVHMDESLSNNGASKSGDDKETHMTASEVVLERPTVEETDSHPDCVNQSMQECPDVTQTSHSSSNHTSPPAVVSTSSISTITCTSQPKAKVNLNASESKPRREATSWTQDEKEKFVEIIRKHGRDWSLLQENLPAKSLTQIKTYFQNSKAKLGFTAAEGLQSRSSVTRKTKNDDSDPANTLYRLAQHNKMASLSEDSALNSDSIVNGGVNSMLGMPGSDGLSFTLSGKGTWQTEDPTVLNGMQKLFQQMCQQKGYSQPPMTTNGPFSVLQPSALSVMMGSGFHQPQSLNLQHSHSPSSSSKSQSVTPQQTQQIVGLSQLQCGLQPPILNQIKQQQKTSQIICHNQQEYPSQGLQEFQKRIMQHQAVQSLQQNISTSVLQQQQSPQPQVILQQQNPQQHLSQSSHHLQHSMNQNIHYLPQQSPLQSHGQLAVVASQQLSSSQQQVINQHQSQSQQHLLNQLQLHYDNQQKQYHMLQGNQVSQQEQHSILRSLQEHLTSQLHHSQQQLQSEKQHQPLRMNFPIHVHENSEISHHQQGQGPDTLPEKEHRQWKEVHNNQSVMLQKGSNQANNKDVPNLQDSNEIKNVLKSQTQEIHQTRAGDVKLFGQFLLSQPTSSSNSTVSTSESGFSKPVLSLSSTSVSPVAASILEGLPYAYPDGTPCLPSGFGRIGLSFSQGQAQHLPRQTTSAGNSGLRNNLLDGKEHGCLTQGVDSETDIQSGQTVMPRLPERFTHDGKENDNIRPEAGSPFLIYEVGDQSKRLHDGQNPVVGFGSKRQGDQSNNFSLSAGDCTTIPDLKSGVPCLSSAADLSIIMARCKDVDFSSAIGAMFVGGIEAMQVNRDDSFLGQQGISHGSGNVGLDVNLWSSGASVGHGSDPHRVTVPVVSSVWPHGSVIIEGQPRPKDPKDVEDNMRQTA